MWQFELSSNKCWRICPALQPCHQSTKSIVSCSSFGCQRWQGGDTKKATAVASQKTSPTQGRKRHDWNQTQWQLETLPPFCWVLSHKTALQSSHQHQLWSGFESCEQSWLMLTLGFLQIKEQYNSMQLTYIIKWKPIIIFPITHGRVMNRLRRCSPLPERKSYGWRSWGCRRLCFLLLLIIMIVNYNNNYYQIEIDLYISYTSSAVYLQKNLPWSTQSSPQPITHQHLQHDIHIASEASLCAWFDINRWGFLPRNSDLFPLYHWAPNVLGIARCQNSQKQWPPGFFWHFESGSAYKPSLANVTGRGPHPKCNHMFTVRLLSIHTRSDKIVILVDKLLG